MWVFTFFALGVAAPRLHHIPKTAGTSARLMLNKYGHWSIGHTECCFGTIPRDRAVVSFIRKPVEQVYSQFLECKYDDWGKRATKKTEFPRFGPDEDDFYQWLQHFNNSVNNFNCYHPYNMQMRSFMPSCKNSHEFAEIDAKKAATALENMYSMTAVGITHHFKLSICVIMYILTQKLLDECTCGTEFQVKHETHKVPPHSVQSLNKSVLALVHKNVHYDHMLYGAAIARFWDQVHMVEAMTAKSLRCLFGK